MFISCKLEQLFRIADALGRSAGLSRGCDSECAAGNPGLCPLCRRRRRHLRQRTRYRRSVGDGPSGLDIALDFHFWIAQFEYLRQDTLQTLIDTYNSILSLTSRRRFKSFRCTVARRHGDSLRKVMIIFSGRSLKRNWRLQVSTSLSDKEFHQRQFWLQTLVVVLSIQNDDRDHFQALARFQLKWLCFSIGIWADALVSFAKD